MFFSKSKNNDSEIFSQFKFTNTIKYPLLFKTKLNGKELSFLGTNHVFSLNNFSLSLAKKLFAAEMLVLENIIGSNVYEKSELNDFLENIHYYMGRNRIKQKNWFKDLTLPQQKKVKEIIATYFKGFFDIDLPKHIPASSFSISTVYMMMMECYMYDPEVLGFSNDENGEYQEGMDEELQRLFFESNKPVAQLETILDRLKAMNAYAKNIEKYLDLEAEFTKRNEYFEENLNGIKYYLNFLILKDTGNKITLPEFMENQLKNSEDEVLVDEDTSGITYANHDIANSSITYIKDFLSSDESDIDAMFRNINWVSKISDITKKYDSKSILFAFGAAHLFGKYGILNLLEKTYGCKFKQFDSKTEEFKDFINKHVLEEELHPLNKNILTNKVFYTPNLRRS